MLRYILRRLVGAAITLVIVLSIVFVLLRQMPIEGYFENYDKLSPAVINARLESLGLNDPIAVQLKDFFASLLRGDLGTSARYMSALAEQLGFGIPSEFSDCPDHLALELDMVAVLLRSGMVDEARTFLSERFNWLTAYRMRLINLGSEANFYVCLCDLLIGIVAEQAEDAA